MDQFFAGVRLFARGVGMWARRPKLMIIGAIPAIIATVLYATMLVLLFVNATAIANWLTQFAADFPNPWPRVIRTGAAFAVVVVGVALTVFTFTAVTLTIAGPFIDAIQERVDRELGGAVSYDDEFWASLGRSILDGLRLLLIGLGAALLVLVCSLIPLIGSVLGTCLGAYFAARALALDLTATPGNARRLSLAERRQLLQTHRPKSLGFGVAVYLSFLIPLGAVIGTPAAAVGGTMLLRELVGEPSQPPR